MTDSNTLLAKALAASVTKDISNHRYGRLAETDFEFTIDTFLEQLDQAAEADDVLYGVVIHFPENLTESEQEFSAGDYDNLLLSTRMEDANGWRDDIHNAVRETTEDLPTRLITLYRGSPDRLTSVEDVLETIRDGHVRRELAKIAKQHYTDQTSKGIWNVIAGDLGEHFDVEALASYAAVCIGSDEQQEKIDSLRTQLYRVGLLPDNELTASDMTRIRQRLEGNIELINHLRSGLNDDEIESLAVALQSGEDPDRGDLSYGTIERRIRNFSRSKENSHLKQVQYLTVKDLLNFSPNPDADDDSEDDVDETEDNSEEEEEDDPDADEDDDEDEHDDPDPISIKANNALVRLLFEQEDYNTVSDLAEKLKDNAQTTAGSGGRLKYTYQEDKYAATFEFKKTDWKIVQAFIGEDSFGGILNTGDEITDYEPSEEDVDQTLFTEERDESRIGRVLDRAAFQDQYQGFKSKFEQYKSKRNDLTDHFASLQFYPLFVLVGDDYLREQVSEYISAYSELVEETYKLYTNGSGRASPSILVELLLLDTILAKVDDPDVENGTELILSPLHPLHLWKFLQFAKAIRDRYEDATEDEQEFVKSTLPAPADVLQVVRLGEHDGLNLNGVTMPHSGSLGLLPKYSNVAPTDIGTNDEVWDYLLEKFLISAPYARDRLHITVTDPVRPLDLIQDAKDLAEQGEIRGFDLMFSYIQRERHGLLDGAIADEREDIIDFLKPDERNRAYRIATTTHETYREFLNSHVSQNPTHALMINGQAKEQQREFEQDKNAQVNPIYIPKTIDFTIDDELILQPQDDDDVFSTYQAISNEISQSGMDTSDVEEVTDDEMHRSLESTIWTTESVPSGNADVNRDISGLVHQGRKGNRDFAIYSGDRSFFTTQLQELLENYPVGLENPEEDIERLLDWAAEHNYTSLLGIVSRDSYDDSISTHAKGHLGTLLALQWLDQEIDGQKLIFSIDDTQTRQWLNLGSTNRRADYFVLSFNDDDGLTLNVVEIKAYSDPDTVIDTEGDNITGDAVEQVLKTAIVVDRIFSDSSDMLIKPRVEALRQQIYYELKSQVSSFDPANTLEWVQRVNNVFQGTAQISINPRVVSIELEDLDEQKTVRGSHGLDIDWGGEVEVNRLPSGTVASLLTDWSDDE